MKWSWPVLRQLIHRSFGDNVSTAVINKIGFGWRIVTWKEMVLAYFVSNYSLLLLL